MLAGLLFLGVLAAVSFPDMMELTRGGGDENTNGDAPDGDLPQDEEIDDQSPLSLPDPEPTVEPSSQETAEGADLLLDPGPGQTMIDSFDPGSDSLTIAIPDEAQEFAVRDTVDGQPAMLSFETDEGAVEILFPELDSVPVNDIFLRISDEDSPTLDVDIGLAQLMDLDSPVILPDDPTLPDAPAPPVEDGGPVILPDDPTLPDLPAPPTEDGGAVLLPVEDDAILSDLTALIDRDGGSSIGAQPEATVIDGPTPDNDAIDLPLTGAAGDLALSQAAPTLDVPGGIPSTIDMGAGDDSLTTGAGAVYGFGGEGNDTLTAGSGAAALYGGAGEDALFGSDGETFLHGGAGADTIIGGEAGEYLEGGEHGTDGADMGNDVIAGNGGADTIRGGWGADSLSGGAGDDVIDHRGADAERIIAEHHEFAWHTDGAPDTLNGGIGNDTLIFDRGDVVTGGAGEDVFWLYADAGVDDGIVAELVDFVPGEDFLRISLNPQSGGAGDVVVSASENGLDGVVQVDGKTVAVLRGAPDATLTDIYVETSPDVFPAG
ncbi:calcium-binding protein [Oceaniglobus ichthyenteri]|uniref:calcium-binding protein n=1 Tax=Oceaniglobus ichthyenteri TaxID=2136177 RepID=UPI000D348796|nr:calcium-binding protein [Oceaniglobus ichthyenteri]